MAGGVTVKVTDRAIISALNTPGGGVYDWRDEIGGEVKSVAIGMSPINDVLNAQHRGGVVGTYVKAWDWDRRGSSGHHVVARITNSSDHAIYVEYGRSSSSAMQIFSWSRYGGKIVRVGGPSPVRTKDDGSHHRYNRSLSRGEVSFNERISKLPEKVGNSTGARAGQHILSRAVAAVLGSSGISARTDL